MPECARALAEDQPEAAGVLQGAAYAAFCGAASATPPVSTSATSSSQRYPKPTNFVVGAVGEARARELRRIGAVMGVDEAVSYALSNIDPKLLSRPIASIDR